MSSLEALRTRIDNEKSNLCTEPGPRTWDAAVIDCYEVSKRLQAANKTFSDPEHPPPGTSDHSHLTRVCITLEHGDSLLGFGRSQGRHQVLLNHRVLQNKLCAIRCCHHCRFVSCASAIVMRLVGHVVYQYCFFTAHIAVFYANTLAQMQQIFPQVGQLLLLCIFKEAID